MYFKMLTRNYLHKIAVLILFISFTGIHCCIFDQIQKDNVRQSIVAYDSHNGKERRSVVKVFEPIRIHVDYHDLDFVLTDSQQLRLKDVVAKTVAKAQKIFSVQRVVGNLLLSRSSEACVLVFQSGINAGKCADVRNSYKGEVCIDDFIIPDDHMEGLEIYNEDDAEPIRVIKQKGAGLPDTDFVLYVRSLNTEACIQVDHNTIAYATYCQLDQKNRPIAGYINFCPDLLREENFSLKKIYVTALHELFHSLGFSNQLFNKFQDCYSSGTCFDRQDIVQKVLGEQRIVSPRVVEVTSAHFNCKTHETVNEFGPMLEVETDTGKVNSHWDAAFMFSSIMTPTIGLVSAVSPLKMVDGETFYNRRHIHFIYSFKPSAAAIPYLSQPDLTKIDHITLALFEDTGWYKVNYDEADFFPWGISGGCDWGRHPQCATMMLDEDCFCTVPGELKCHYLHRSKGSCETDQYLHNCFVYKTSKKESCQLRENSPVSEVTSLTGELYTEDSRCFIANLTNILADTEEFVPVEGRCYQTRCNGSTVEVKIGDSPWTTCQNETQITVPGYRGVLECPHNGILCPAVESMEEPCPEPEPIYSTSTTQSSSSTTVGTTAASFEHFIPDSNLDVICVEIIFENPDYELLVRERKDVAFKAACLSKVQLLSGVKRSRLSSVHLLSGSTLFRFDILPAQYPGDGHRTSDVIATLRDAVYSKNFTILLTAEGELYVANGLNQMVGGPQVSMDHTPKGVIAAMVVGSLVAALIIGIAVFFVQRYYTMHSQIQRNAAPPHEGTNIQRRLSHDSALTNRSITSNSSGNTAVIRNPTVAVDTARNYSNREWHVPGASSAGQRDKSQPGSRQRTLVSGHQNQGRSAASVYKDLGDRSPVERTPELQVDTLDKSLVQQFPVPHHHSQTESFRESPISVVSSASRRNNNRSVSPEVPLRNTAVRAYKQSQKKPCIFQCKCAWFKDRLKSPNKPSVNREKSPKSVAKYKIEQEEQKGYFPSVVHYCPGTVEKDYNANFYPNVLSLEDIVAHEKNNYHAPSIHTSSNSSDDIVFLGGATTNTQKNFSSVKIYDSHSNPVPGYAQNYSQMLALEDKSFQENPSPRISHYSSCNSFVDNEDRPTHKTCIELASVNPNRTSPRPASSSISQPDSLVYQPISSISHPSSSAVYSESSSSSHPKSALFHPGSISLGSSSCAHKAVGSMFTVNGSQIDQDVSQSTLETQHSGSIAGATDTDVSYLASTVKLKGHRNSTNSWKSFSSDTSIDSSAVKVKA